MRKIATRLALVLAITGLLAPLAAANDGYWLLDGLTTRRDKPQARGYVLGVVHTVLLMQSVGIALDDDAPKICLDSRVTLDAMADTVVAFLKDEKNKDGLRHPASVAVIASVTMRWPCPS